ncbi:MAG TPA: helix-turn-helix transcriptional regulator [Thermomicrobiaceae bacterium]|nr:helix-turn-helix transcriptional regulator [Thermomicrobiaceae bacterium]
MTTLQELRRLHGMSAEDLARRIGVAPAVVLDWESGETSPNDRQLALLARIFGVSQNALADATTLTPMPGPVGRGGTGANANASESPRPAAIEG